MGGNMSSRLFINIRERLGLCYFIRSSVNVYEDIGNFVIQAGLDRKRIKEAITKIIEEIQKAKQRGITIHELEQAKEFLKGKLMLEMEDSENIAGWYGTQALLTGKTLTMEQRFKRIQKIKISDIKRVAKDIFKIGKINIALIGPYHQKQDFLKLLKYS
jgi:predicted Zn-dependent peptidase